MVEPLCENFGVLIFERAPESGFLYSLELGMATVFADKNTMYLVPGFSHCMLALNACSATSKTACNE